MSVFARENFAEQGRSTVTTSKAQTKDPAKTALILIAIAAVILIIIVIIVTILRNRAASRNASSTSTNIPVAPEIKCATDLDCPDRCHPNLKICVECLDDTTCDDFKFPVCNTLSSKCVECLDDSTCNEFSTCDKNECCDPRRPIIDSVNFNLFAEFTNRKVSNASITINYTYFQNPRKARLFILFEDPATGKTIGPAAKICNTKVSCPFSSACPAGQSCISGKCSWPSCIESTVTGQVIVSEANTGMFFFQAADYNLRLQILYDCGSLTNQLTEVSLPISFSTPVCGDPSFTPTIYAVGDAQDLETNPREGLYVVVSRIPPIRVRYLVSDSPGTHPALCQILGPYSYESFGQTDMNGILVYLGVYPPSPGTYYLRAFDITSNFDCFSGYSNELSYIYDP